MPERELRLKATFPFAARRVLSRARRKSGRESETRLASTSSILSRSEGVSCLIPLLTCLQIYTTIIQAMSQAQAGEWVLLRCRNYVQNRTHVPLTETTFWLVASKFL